MNAIAQRTVHLLFGPGSQAHFGEVVHPNGLSEEIDHQGPDRETDGKKKERKPKFFAPVDEFSSFQFVPLQ
tara:strand:- start:2176 stop:2388 length:213 start_codon:yes stop_codon:yes gene_type:complete